MLSPNDNPDWPAQDSSGSQITGEDKELNFLPPEELNRPLWRSLVGNLADTISPPRLPPLRLMSRPVNIGMLLADRLHTPWYRTIFTNIGDVLSPETLPPLELESRPVDVGELLGDQLSHLWFSSFIRSLADVVAPERQEALQVISKPDPAVLPADTIMLLPRWSSVIDGPKIFYPDAPKAAYTAQPGRAAPAPPPVPEPPKVLLDFLHDMHSDLRRDLGRSRLRVRLWMALAGAQVLLLATSLFWPLSK